MWRLLGKEREQWLLWEREDQCGRPSSIIVVIIAMDGVVKSAGNGNWQAQNKIDTLFSALESLTFIILEFHVVSFLGPGSSSVVVRCLFNVSHSIDISPAGRREWNLFGRLSVAAPCELFYVRNIVAPEMFEGELVSVVPSFFVLTTF